MFKKSLAAMFVVALIYSCLFTNLTVFAATSEGLSLTDPADVDMLSQPLDDLDEEINQAIGKNVMPGAVVSIARHGKIVKQQAYGYAARYVDDRFTEMDEPVDMQNNTIFDIASMSKLFTGTAVMQLWDQGKFELDDPVAKYIPEFAANGKADITIKQLLTHTSGLKPGPSKNLYAVDGTREDRLDFVLKDKPQTTPNTDYIYSDSNYMTLGVLVERLSGQREDQFVKAHITEPLKMKNTMYDPPAALKGQIAATEYQPWTKRGLVWGSVHDENAWALDGVAGHAGVFSTADDLTRLAETMLHEGEYEGVRILSEDAVKLMKKNWNTAFPGQDHGLGWELNQDWYMDELADDDTMGHTGYTGTSIVISPTNDTVAILLTNRVHPTRETVSTNPIRKKVSEKTANAIYGWNADAMKRFVKKLEQDGEFDNEKVSHALLTHLTAVGHFEDQGKEDKVIKHLQGFKLLLEQQKKKNLMTLNAYNHLQDSTGYLLTK